MISIIKKTKEKAKDSKLGNLVGGFLALNLATSQLSSILNRATDKEFYKKYEEKKYKKLNELKGGNNIMETKSRYEVIADLEEKKRSLILARDSLGDELKEMKRRLRDMKRDVEDREEEIKDFEESMKDQKETTNELIKSVDESLDRFAELSKKKS